MAIDTRRVILAAFEAALDDVVSAAPKPGEKKKKKKKHGLPAGRAVLLGAGAVTAVRLAVSPRARELAGSVQERLTEYVEDGAGD